MAQVVKERFEAEVFKVVAAGHKDGLNAEEMQAILQSVRIKACETGGT